MMLIACRVVCDCNRMGNSSICRTPVLLPMVDDVVSKTGGAPLTVMTCVTAPTVIFKSTVIACPANT